METTMMEKTVEVTDGKQVATILLSYYLNSYDRVHPDFMGLMYRERPEIRTNFMVLIVQWFFNLASRKTYEWDERNEKSVEMANILKAQLSQVDLKVRPVKKRNLENQIQVSYQEGQSVEQMMAAYLALTEETEEPFKIFMSGLANEHRTLQQNFTRFVQEWCQWLVKENPTGRSREMRIAKMVAQTLVPLPYI